MALLFLSLSCLLISSVHGCSPSSSPGNFAPTTTVNFVMNVTYPSVHWSFNSPPGNGQRSSASAALSAITTETNELVREILQQNGYPSDAISASNINMTPALEGLSTTAATCDDAKFRVVEDLNMIIKGCDDGNDAVLEMRRVTGTFAAIQVVSSAQWKSLANRLKSRFADIGAIVEGISLTGV